MSSTVYKDDINNLMRMSNVIYASEIYCIIYQICLFSKVTCKSLFTFIILDKLSKKLLQYQSFTGLSINHIDNLYRDLTTEELNFKLK